MPRISAKKIAIDKANKTVFITVAVASFVVAFSLVASKTLLDQRAYQAKAESAKQETLDILKKNIDESQKLTTAYQEFAGQPTNVIGGNSQGEGDRDGDNPRLVLDSLPSKYDFPGLLSSVEKILKDNKFKLDAIEGDDDEVAQKDAASSPSPQAVEMPFSVTVVANGAALSPLLKVFESSIRPMQVKNIVYKYDEDDPKITVDMTSYYQSGKNFNVTEEPLK